MFMLLMVFYYVIFTACAAATYGILWLMGTTPDPLECVLFTLVGWVLGSRALQVLEQVEGEVKQ